MHRRIILAAMVAALAFAGLACNGDKSPTDPIEDQERLAWCETYAERCSWYTEVTVKLADSPKVIGGAQGLILSNATQESHQFVTGQNGSSGEIRWAQFVPSSTFRLTILPPQGSGLSWETFDRLDVRPLCSAHPEIERGVVCRVVAEVTPNGIGGAAR